MTNGTKTKSEDLRGRIGWRETGKGEKVSLKQPSVHQFTVQQPATLLKRGRPANIAPTCSDEGDEPKDYKTRPADISSANIPLHLGIK